MNVIKRILVKGIFTFRRCLQSGFALENGNFSPLPAQGMAFTESVQRANEPPSGTVNGKNSNPDIGPRPIPTQKQPNPHKFGRHELVVSIIGIVLYGLLEVITNGLQIPSGGYLTARPEVAIALFFGIAFGPWVGFLTGFFGNFLGDLFSGFGILIWSDFGTGLMGLIAGMAATQITNYRNSKSILRAELYCVLGILAGIGLASISDMWVSGADIKTVVFVDFIPTVIPDMLNGLILVPIFMLIYQAYLSRSTR